MDPASAAENGRRVDEEPQRMALEELRGAGHLTKADMAEMLDVPQSSISRLERRTDMYLSTLRNYIHAVGGELRIQAVFPDGGTVVINRFGEYEERPYLVDAVSEGGGLFRLRARPLHRQGASLAAGPFKVSGLIKSMRALHLPEGQIARIREGLENKTGKIEIGGGSSAIERVFSVQDLVTAGFEVVNAEQARTDRSVRRPVERS